MKKKTSISKEKKESRSNPVTRTCIDVFDAFEFPTMGRGPGLSQPSMFIDELCDWGKLVGPDADEKFEKLYDAIKVAFGVGYVVGQMLDLNSDVDLAPIKKALREKGALLYMPHEKTA